MELPTAPSSEDKVASTLKKLLDEFSEFKEEAKKTAGKNQKLVKENKYLKKENKKIKELSQKITELENKLNQQKGNIQKLENRLTKVEAEGERDAEGKQDLFEVRDDDMSGYATVENFEAVDETLEILKKYLNRNGTFTQPIHLLLDFAVMTAAGGTELGVLNSRGPTTLLTPEQRQAVLFQLKKMSTQLRVKTSCTTK